ncbi:MAG: type II toxin-antitoxin system mRNA interferase toxin, RelE/StbE family [Hormoscilla sp. SP5CHS1]|nr:type II toxin-antitoxin system mRNA interferase toxin, RelE/StbE family [Hormoscilla sp. SP12CHS1]MBC6456145.1 type II toxin-antitoxin system mRNA interferase toxin, RelE/StbE family [Hormoscilla sp. SP5CHS1]
MTDYQILFSKKAKKDIEQLTAQQKAKLQEILLQFIATNPYTGKQLKGQLTGFYSYRLTRKDRIVYEIIEDDKVVFVIRARSHYGE